MTRSTKALAVALLGLLPAAAWSLDWSAQLGYRHTRNGSWVTGQSGGENKINDLDLRLDTSGYFGARDVFSWTAGGAYQLGWSTSQAGDRDSNALQWQVGANVLATRHSPLHINFSGIRATSEFSASNNTEATGRSDATSFNVTAVWEDVVRPSLSVTYGQRDADETFPGIADHTVHTKRIGAFAKHGISAFTFQTAFSQLWSEGSWSSDNFSEQGVNVTVAAPVNKETRLWANQGYSRRTPTSADGLNFATEGHFFTGGVRSGQAFESLQTGTYMYAFQSAEATGSPASESTRHSLRYEGHFPIVEQSWFAATSADLSYSLQSRASTTEEGVGETLGTEVWWRQTDLDVSKEFHAGPRIALLQSPAGNQVGYGATAAAQAAMPWRGYAGSASYQVGYGSDLYGTRGSYLEQVINAAVSRPFAQWTGRLQLQGTARRSWSPLFDAAASRALTGTATFSDPAHSLGASFSLSQGTIGSTSGRFVGDGLFLPAPFDSRTMGFGLSAAASLFEGLGAAANVRWESRDVRGSPSGRSARLWVR